MMDELLEIADVRLGGDRPWDIRLLVDGVPERVFAQGNLGLGESYMNGAWECDRLDELFDRILRARLDRHVKPLRLMFHSLRAKLLNRQTSRQAWEVGEAHYDLGNDFYTAMLDPRMTYTCGYCRCEEPGGGAGSQARHDLPQVAHRPGMRVLDIGCGWGSFMAYAAEHYGVECVG